MSILSALNPYMVYVKIGVVVVVALLIGGLYEYGKHEAARVDALNTEIGVAKKTIADDEASIKGWQHVNDLWVAAMAKYQASVKAQDNALKSADAAKEALDVQLKLALQALRENSPKAADLLNVDVAHVICMLNRATGGTGRCEQSAVAPGSSGTRAPGAP